MWFALLLIILMSTLLWLLLRKPSNYPPGPWGLPLIGSPPSSLEEFNLQLLKYRDENRDVVGWRIGSYFIVIFLDYELFQEAFKHPNLSFKPDVDTLTNIRGTKTLGIIHSAGDQWMQNRRFALKSLRDLGMGKEKQLLDAHFEADNFIQDLKKRIGKPISIPESLLISILNNIWQMVGNKRYEYEDKDIANFIKLVSDLRIHGSRLVILDVFPWLENILPTFLLQIFFKFKTLDELSGKILNYFKQSIYKHMKDFDKNVLKDFIDAYLLEKDKRKNVPDSLMSIEDLTLTLSDLFVGATETTTHSIHWSILYLAKYQNVQEKVQEEIDRILPNGTQFQMKHKTELPYTEAFIHELLRISSVTPCPPREAVEDTKIGPYFIPKGAWVLGQSFVMHHDTKYWDSPYELRPERFLDSKGKFVAPGKGFAPFGSGKRICFGETIARAQLYVYITKLVQTFHFDPPPGEEISLEGLVNPFFRPPKGSPKFLVKPR